MVRVTKAIVRDPWVPPQYDNCPHYDTWGQFFVNGYCPECRAIIKGWVYRQFEPDPIPPFELPPLRDDKAERLARYRKHLERNA